jgi:hypothetical protein
MNCREPLKACYTHANISNRMTKSIVPTISLCALTYKKIYDLICSVLGFTEHPVAGLGTQLLHIPLTGLFFPSNNSSLDDPIN